MPESKAPFNPTFFRSVFPGRVRRCRGPSGKVAVVLLQLADRRELHLCHIETLAPRWMAAAVFTDGSSPPGTDTVFVPYDMITRVTLSRREPEERHMGFRMGRTSIPPDEEEKQEAEAEAAFAAKEEEP